MKKENLVKDILERLDSDTIIRACLSSYKETGSTAAFVALFRIRELLQELLLQKEISE